MALTSSDVIVIVVVVILMIAIIVAIVYFGIKAWNRQVRHEMGEDMKFIADVNNKSDLQHGHIDIPVYYINLKRSPERNDFMSEQLQRHHVKEWKRVEGVDGSNDSSVTYTNDFF